MILGLCAISESSASKCWSRYRSRMIDLPQQSRWVSFSGHLNATCGFQEDGSAWCWGGQIPISNLWVDPPPPEERFNWIYTDKPIQVAGKWRTFDVNFCGITFDHELTCMEKPQSGSLEPAQPATTKLPGKWKTVEWNRNNSCAIRQDQKMWCWKPLDGMLTSQDGDIMKTGEMAGRWLDISVAPGAICGRQTDFTVWCWEVQSGELRDLGRRNRTRVRGFPKGFATTRGVTCQWYGSGETFCQGFTRRFAPDRHGCRAPVATTACSIKLDGKWDRMLQGTDCGVKMDKSLWCVLFTNRMDRDPAWREISDGWPGDVNTETAAYRYGLVCVIRDSDRQVYCMDVLDRGRSRVFPPVQGNYATLTKVPFG